ncbi:hypothetical protein F4782DRAFT_551106 [Xylaria castorea]|nr:hypothetical protein F4782DRAFT_551106 [Xylaria castorea]
MPTMLTPATSFSSEEGHRKHSRGVPFSKTAPPSPRRSDAGSVADDLSTPETDSDEELEGLIKDQFAFREIIKVVSSRLGGDTQTEGADGNPAFHLSRKERSYADLLERLEQHGLRKFFESLRLRWDADSGELVLLLMADPIHECFKIKFDFGLSRQLNNLAAGTPVVANLMEDIAFGAHSSVKKMDLSGRRNPDGQIYFGEAPYPSLVYEIAHGESEADLQKTANQYFDQWPDAIGAVLCFKFSYDKQRKDPDFEYTASVSLWTATLAEDGTMHQKHVFNQIFWQDGEAVAGSLTLPLELFIPPYLRQAVLPDGRDNACVCLDFTEMEKWAAYAAKRQRVAAGPPVPQGLGVVKRTARTDLDGNVTVIERPAKAPAPKRTSGKEVS